MPSPETDRQWQTLLADDEESWQPHSRRAQGGVREQSDMNLAGRNPKAGLLGEKTQGCLRLR
jgi:hypothetical protein